MGNTQSRVCTAIEMNEPPSPVFPPRLPGNITVLTTVATTVSLTFFITFWVADVFVISYVKPIFDAFGAQLPMLTQLMFERNGYSLMGLGAIGSGIFCYGAYRHWVSRRLALVLLAGTIVLTLADVALAFLALCLPFLAIIDQLK